MMARPVFAVALAVGLASTPSAAPSDAPVWQRGVGVYEKPVNQADDVAIIAVKQKAAEDAVGKVYGRSLERSMHQLTTVRDKSKSSFVYRKLSLMTNGIVIDSRKASRVDVKFHRDAKGNVNGTTFTYSADFLVRPAPVPDPNYLVNMALGSSNLYSGDTISFDVEANKASDVLVFVLAADNRVYVVYPNAYVQALHLEPDRKLHVPAPGDSFEVKSYNLDGHQLDEEVLWAVATRQPVIPPHAKDGDMAVTDFMAWLAGLPPGSWSSAQQPYAILARTKETP